MPSAITTDAVVIGAGPVGLFQVFELGLLDIRAHVIDALPYVGGQPVELYPDKPIYDIPAVPVITGQGLAEALMAQIKPFQPTFHLGQQVTELQQQDDGRFFLRTSTGTTFLTRTVFIAAGVGAFQPRKLKVAGLGAFEGSQVFYRVQDPLQFAGKNLVIVGGGDSALDWTLQFVENQAHQAESVILVHRREGFRAAPASVARMQALCADLHMQFMVGQITGFDTDANARLSAVKVAGSDGVTRNVPLDMLLVFFGLSPKLGPIAEWGMELARKQLVVDTEKFSTSIPGIFAVGDVNTYPGKKKLILSGFHECALAAYGAADLLHPEKPTFFQYTTTSPKLHKVLGVDTPNFD